MKTSFISKSGMTASWMGLTLFAVMASGVGMYNFSNYKIAESEIKILKVELEELLNEQAVTKDELTIVSEKLRLKTAESRAKAAELEKVNKLRNIFSSKTDKRK